MHASRHNNAQSLPFRGGSRHARNVSHRDGAHVDFNVLAIEEIPVVV